MGMKHSCNIDDLLSVFKDSLTSTDIVASQILADISVAITRCRKEMDMTQRQFADYMNVTQGMVSKWESSDYNFSIKTLVDMAEKLDMELNVSLRKEKSYNNDTHNENAFAVISSKERMFEKKAPSYLPEGKQKVTMFNTKTEPEKKIIFKVVNSKKTNWMEG